MSGFQKFLENANYERAMHRFHIFFGTKINFMLQFHVFKNMLKYSYSEWTCRADIPVAAHGSLRVTGMRNGEKWLCQPCCYKTMIPLC